MANSNEIHIKTTTGLLQASKTQVETMEPGNGTQADAKEDLGNAIDAILSTEIIAIRIAFGLPEEIAI